MIMVRAGRSMVRSMWVTSAIAAGPRAAKNGTLLTDSQVFRKLSRRVSAANPVARIPVQSPNTPRPQIITKAATTRPSGVIGTTSPYPTVVKDEGDRYAQAGACVHQSASGQHEVPSPLRQDGIAEPHHPFQRKEGQARPQPDVDPAMRRFISGIDREKKHHDDAGQNRGIGRLGHITAGRRGC